MKTLNIIKPDDWHLHLREGLVLKNIIQFTSEYFGRAIVMPNTKSPITSINSAISYRKSIVEALPESSKFEPLMTIYLTDDTDKGELINGFKNNVFFAAKLYPANATTNSSHGVRKIENLYKIFELMQDSGMPLLIHGEVTDSEVDIFDREEVFIDKELSQITKRFPKLKIVLEHITTSYAVDFVQENIYFHGNNKTPAELNMALDNQTGTIVVDNLDELRMLNELAGRKNKLQKIMLRVSPSVDPHTHVKTTTGTLDSKFGLSIQNGQATQALLEALDMVNLDLAGLHFHLGSPIYELEPYSTAIDIVLNFAKKFETNGFELREFSPGGGFAIAYTHDKPPPLISSYADTITSSVITSCRNLNLVEPKIVIESGRALIGRSGVALYSVGTTKDIPGIRKYVSLDGGMGDNIRPALYGSKYEAVLANRMSDPGIETVTLAGKFCESGDVLINDIKLPLLKPDDIIAIPACGAYAPSMASNYNLNPRPPVILVKDGDPRMIRRRETYEDMMLCDI